jgi:hypothetical protein
MRERRYRNHVQAIQQNIQDLKETIALLRTKQVATLATPDKE